MSTRPQQPWTRGCPWRCDEPATCDCAIAYRELEAERADAGPLDRDRRLAHDAGIPLYGEIP